MKYFNWKNQCIFVSGKLYCHNFLKISSKGSLLSQSKPLLMSVQAGCSHPSKVDKEPGRLRNSIFASTLHTLTFSSSLVGKWILPGYCPICSYFLAVHFVSFFLQWGDRTVWRRLEGLLINARKYPPNTTKDVATRSNQAAPP